VLDDTTHVARAKAHDIARDEAFEALADAEHLHFLVAACANDSANRGIHAGRVTSTGKYCYTVH
jgi:hypothetical protein